MLELNTLCFAVDTSELDVAVNKIDGLASSFSKLTPALSAVKKKSDETASSQVDVGKAGEEAAKGLSAVEKVLERNATKMKVLRDESITLKDGVEQLGKGFTSSQASQLASLKMMGATVDQIKLLSRSFQDYNDITGVNTFDASANGLSRIQKEIKELNAVNDLASKGLNLTREELKFLARDTNSLTQAFQSEGKSSSDLASALERLNAEFLQASKVRNQLIAEAKQHEDAIKAEALAIVQAHKAQEDSAEAMFRNHQLRQKQDQQTYAIQMKEMRDFYAAQEKASNVVVKDVSYNAHTDAYYKKQEQAAKDAAKATDWLTKEMQRAEQALVNLNEGLNVSTSNRLQKFEQQLKASGIASAEAAVMMQKYETAITTTQQQQSVKRKKDREEELKYLARATSVQLGDIGVSLAGGQNPLTVFIQQGDQLRGVLNQVGGDAKEMQAAMSQAFKQIIVGFVDVTKALGTFVIGAIMDTGKAVLDFSFKLVGAEKAMQQLTESSPRLASILTNVIGGSIGIVVAAIGVAIAAFVQLDKEQTQIAKSSTLVGASMGLTMDSVRTMADELGNAQGNTTKATKAILAMAEAGGITSNQIQIIGNAALQMERDVGIPVEDTIKQFKKLADEPAKALIEVAQQTGFVSAETVKMVIELENAGKKSEAAALAQKAYADATKEAAKTIPQNYGVLQQLAITTGQFFSDMWDKILGVGRSDDLENRIAEIKSRISDVSSNSGFLSFTLSDEGRAKMLKDLNMQLEGLEKQKAANIRIGILREKQAADSKLLAEAEVLLGKNLSASQKYQVETNKLIELEQNLAARGLLTSQEKLRIDRQRAELYDDYLKQFKKEPKVRKDPKETFFEKSMKTFEKDVNKATGAQEQFTKAQIDFLNVAADPMWLKLTERQRLEITQKAELAIAQEKIVENSKEELKAQLALQKVWDKTVDAQTKRDNADFDMLAKLDTKSELIDEELTSLMLQKAIYGDLTTEQKKQIELAKIQKKYAKEIADIQNDTKTSDEAKLLAKQKAEDNRRKEVSKLDIASDLERQKQLISSYKNLADVLTDVISTSLFDGGKTGAKKLESYLKNEFKSAITLQIKAAISYTGNDDKSLLSAATDSNSILGGLSGLSTGFSGGFSSLLGAKSVGGFFEAATGLMGTGTLAGASSGIGMIAGAAAPIIAGLQFLSSLDNSGTYHTGGLGGYSASGGAVTGTSTGLRFGVDAKDYTATAEAAAVSLSKSMVNILDQTANTFGKEAGYYAATAFADDTSDDGAWGALAIKLGDKMVLNWADAVDAADINIPKIFADGEEGAKQYANAVAKSFVDVLNGMDLPEWASNVLASIGDDPSMEQVTTALDTINKMPATILESIGTSVTSLSDILINGMQQSDPVGAGQAFADQITFGIENSLYQGFAQQITNIISTQLVTPIVSAMTAGATITEAMSKASIEIMLDQVKAAGTAFAAIVNNPEFKSALDEVNTMIAGAVSGGIAGFTAPIAPTAYNSVEATKAINDSTSATSNLTDSLQSYAKEAIQLEIEYLTLTGNISKAKEMTRALAIEGLSELEIQAYDTNQALKDKIELYKKEQQALEDFWNAVEGSLSVFFSGNDLRYAQTTFIAQKLSKAGIGESYGSNYAQMAKDLMTLSSKQIKDLAAAFVLSADNSVEAKTAVLQVVASLVDLADAAENQANEALVRFYDTLINNAVKGTDDALIALEKSISKSITAIEDEIKAIDEQISIKEKAIDSIKEVFDVLKTSVEGLYLQVSSTNKQEVNKASKFISDAFLVALQTGVLPDAKELEKAISLVTSDLDATQFKTKFDADKQRLLLANMLSEFQDLADNQLTDADRQLLVLKDQQTLLEQSKTDLEKQLEYWKEQIDISRGIQSATLDVVTAINNLATALGIEQSVKANSIVMKGTNDNSVNYNTKTGIGTAINADTGATVSINGNDLLSAAQAHLAAGGDPMRIYELASQTGYSSSQMDTILGLPSGTIAAESQKLGMPTFADGGMHSGGIRLVGEQGPELEVTGPARYYSASQTASMLSGNSDKEELEMLRYEVRAVALHTAKLDSKLDRVFVPTAGGDALTVKVVT